MAPPVQLRCLVTGVRVNQALPYFLTLQVRARPPAVPRLPRKRRFSFATRTTGGEPGRDERAGTGRAKLVVIV